MQKSNGKPYFFIEFELRLIKTIPHKNLKSIDKSAAFFTKWCVIGSAGLHARTHTTPIYEYYLLNRIA